MAVSLKRDPQNYMCHAWLPEDRLVLATDHGEILLFENFEFRMVLSSSPQDGEPLYSIQPYSKGFVCGGAGGVMRIYERSDDIREYFKCSKTFNIENNRSAIVQLAVSPSEDSLICSTDNFQLYSFALSNTDILKEDSGANFEFLTGCGFHGPGPASSAMICGMDVCVWKPLLATCGRDRTVRIWNYQEKTAELTKSFQEEPHSIALHPSGLYVVVGFTDKLRLMSLLMDDMRVVKELSVKACRSCRFSNGGNMFAAVNQTAVQIFDTYTCATRMQLRAHQQAVRSIIWTDRDRKIVTVGKDGNVYLWDARTGDQLHESIQPRTTFTTAALTGDAISPTSRLFAYSADRMLKAFTAVNMSPENQASADCILCFTATSTLRVV
jgi:WD40 repeat protein